MRTVAIEEHASTPELYDAIGPIMNPETQAVMNDMGEGRLAGMDEAQIDMAVLSLQPPFPIDEVDEGKAELACRAFNDAAAQAIADHPDRFSAFGAVPIGDTDVAVKEVERAVNELGFPAIMIGTRTKLGFMSEEANWPVWEAAENLGIPVYMHPALPPKAVVDAYYADLGPLLGLGMQTALWGWHVDTGMHTIRMILRGVFDRFPKLQVIVGHMGEAIPFMLGRLEERFAGIAEAMPPGWVTPFEKPVRQYFRDNVHFSTSGFFDNESLICTISAVGADRIMLAVDYPFSKNIDARNFIDNAPISDADREAIAHGNADRLLRLPVASPTTTS
jgi:predicted TIM-barrel fold metal-dependent hydrolase